MPFLKKIAAGPRIPQRWAMIDDWFILDFRPTFCRAPMAGGRLTRA
jgi:hypothetical protein